MGHVLRTKASQTKSYNQTSETLTMNHYTEKTPPLSLPCSQELMEKTQAFCSLCDRAASAHEGAPIFRWILDFRLNTVMTKNKFSWLFYLKDNF